MRVVPPRSPFRAAARILSSVVASVALLLAPSVAHGDLAPGTWTLDGEVTGAVVRPDATYVSGTFTQQQTRTGGAVLVDADDGRLVPPIPAVVGTVTAAVPDGADGWFLGGSFTHVGGERRRNLAHVRRDGSVDPAFDPAPDAAAIRDLALVDGTLYVAGPFGRIGGVERQSVAALRASDGAVLDWDARVEDGGVRSFARDGHTLYLGGSFARVDGEARPGLAAIDLRTRELTPWTAPEAPRIIGQIVLAGGRIYARAEAGEGAGTPESRLSAFRVADGSRTDWAPEPDVVPRALATDGETVFVGGAFDRIAGHDRPDVAAFDASTGQLREDWAPGSTRGASALAIADGRLYAGEFHPGAQTDAAASWGAATYDLATGRRGSWFPTPNGRVDVVVPAGDEVLVGGAFSGAGPTLARIASVLRVRRDGALDTSWDPEFSGAVFAIAEDAGTLYAAGSFATVGGQPRSRLAAIDTQSGTVTPWTAPRFGDAITTLAAARGSVFVAGRFSAVGGEQRLGLVALDGTSGALRPWPLGLDNGRQVSRLVSTGDAVWPVGGGPVGGVERVAPRIDATTGVVTDGGASWVAGTDRGILTATDRDLFVSAREDGHPQIRTYDRVTGDSRIWGQEDTSGAPEGRPYVGGPHAYRMRELGTVTDLREHEIRTYGTEGGAPAAGVSGTITGDSVLIRDAGAGLVAVGGRMFGFDGRPTGPLALLPDPAPTRERPAPDVFAPTVDVIHPREGAVVGVGDATPTFSCADEPGGTGVASCERLGAAPTTAGTHTVSVRGVDRAGNERIVRRSYTIVAGSSVTPPPGTPMLPWALLLPPTGTTPPSDGRRAPAPAEGAGPSRAAIRRALDRSLQAATRPLRALRSRSRATLAATVPSGGRLTLTVTARVGGRTRTIARATVRRARAGRYRLVVRRTSAGGRLLRRSRRPSVTRVRVRIELASHAGPRVARARTVSLTT